MCRERREERRGRRGCGQMVRWLLSIAVRAAAVEVAAGGGLELPDWVTGLPRRAL